MTSNKNESFISMRTAAIGILSFLIGWSSWQSYEIIALDKTVAAQGDISADLQQYKTAQDAINRKNSEDNVNLKIDVATTKEVVKLIGERYQINSDAVEQRVNNMIRSESGTTTTSVTTASNL